MSQPAFRAMALGEDEFDEPTPAASEEEAFVMRHFAAAAALLISQPEMYAELRARHRREGATEEVRAAAHESAEQIATVLGSLRRRPDLVAAVGDTPFGASAPLAVLDQLFFSFCLLSGPHDELLDAALDEEAPAELIETLDVKRWLEELGVRG